MFSFDNLLKTDDQPVGSSRWDIASPEFVDVRKEKKSTNSRLQTAAGGSRCGRGRGRERCRGGESSVAFFIQSLSAGTVLNDMIANL